MVSETTPQVNIGNKYLSTKEAFDQSDHDFVSEESFIPKECEAKTRGDQSDVHLFVVKFHRRTVIRRSQNEKARIAVENQQEQQQQQPLIERRFTPLEEEEEEEQPKLPVKRGGEEECFGKVSQATLEQSYLQRKSRGRRRNAGKPLTELKVDLNLNPNFNLEVKRDFPISEKRKKKKKKEHNELLFWRLKTLTGKPLCEAPFKRPLSWSYLALLLNLLLTVLAFSPLISSSSSSSPSSLYALDWKVPEGAKLLVSSESKSFSRQQRQITPAWTSWTPIQQQQYQLKHLQLNQQQQQQQHQISHQNVPYKTCK